MTTAPTLNLLRIEAALSTSSWRPWKAEKDVGRCGNNFLSSERDGEYIGDLCRSQDADLIVELVNAAPAMVARIRELEAESAAAHAALSQDAYLAHGGLAGKPLAERAAGSAYRTASMEQDRTKQAERIAELEAALGEACFIGEAACACTSERGRTTTAGYSARLAALRSKLP